MNKKYINSILIAMLLFIWGAVIYKHFWKPKHSEQVKLDSTSSNYKREEAVKLKDTFKLEIRNKTPFKAYSAPNTNSIAVRPKMVYTTRKPLEVKTVSWPKISYHGFVKNDKSKRKLIILKVNGKLSRKRERESVGELVLLKAYNDSIIVKFKNSKKTINRK
jgi:hypothetical protein